MSVNINQLLVTWNCPTCGVIQTPELPACNCHQETKWIKLDIDESLPIVLVNFDMIDGKLVKIY